jgi:uncharacterized protein (DUF169 family)
MKSVSEVNRMGEAVEFWLRMRVHPIAFKLIKDENEIPLEAIVPSRDIGKKLNLCQAFSMVQREGATVAMCLNDHWCFEPVIGLGFAERIPKFLSGYHRYPDSVRDLDAAARWCRNMPHLERKGQIGLLMAPVHTCTFMPDVIVMHINGMMASQMMIVKNWMDGGDVSCQISGHAGCVYAIVPAIQKQSCNIAIPCRGDRQVGMAQDDEIFFSFVPDMLPDFIAGIDVLEKNGWGIPMHHFLKEEVTMRPRYMDMARLLEMDVPSGTPE